MKNSIVAALAVVAILVVAPYAFAAEESEQTLSTNKFLTLGDLEGVEIHTHQGEKLGSVDQVVIDIDEGRLAYVVVSHGGFLGIGARTVLVPWNAFLAPSRPAGEDVALVLNIERRQFRNAPHGNLETVLDREQGIEIHRFYGVSPYWESE